ncbi:MAG: lactate utilization protein [Campylobacteraceae bacterium]|nr:lactate utilization protein [Campylobacteraceae bacterium]
MSSKNTILENIKKANLSTSTEIPSLDIKHVHYKNKNEQFKIMLKSVGGVASWLETGESIENFIEHNYDNPGIIATNIELSLKRTKINDIDDPHSLKNTDLCIIKGEFGVAENGAVWVQEDDNKNRAIYFIARKLLILVKKENIVDSMHEAYKKIGFKKSGFGTFISGPSKTADIEQALVIGAHGAMECRVLFI